MLLLKLYKNQVKDLKRVLSLIGRWKRGARETVHSLRDYIVLVGDVDLNGNGGMYLPILEFLEGVEYGELQGIAL